MSFLKNGTKLISYPFRFEEFQGRITVAEKVWPSQHTATLHWQLLTAQHLEKSQQPYSILQVINKILHLHRWLAFSKEKNIFITTNLCFYCIEISIPRKNTNKQHTTFSQNTNPAYPKLTYILTIVLDSMFTNLT